MFFQTESLHLPLPGPLQRDHELTRIDARKSLIRGEFFELGQILSVCLAPGIARCFGFVEDKGLFPGAIDSGGIGRKN